jgi:uncharacterized SAM-binding protein YcdF (DUF218 family)
MMVAVKKIAAPFLLPPGIFIVSIIVIGLLLIRSRRWRLGMVNLFIGLALWALSMMPVANGLMQRLESGFSFPENPSGDVIILLGGGVLSEVPDLSGKGAPKTSMTGRILTAVRLHRRLQRPIIVNGGGVYEDNPIAEATIVQRFLMDLGVPRNHIIIEDQARDTAQNARLSAAICRKRGFSKPIVLTAAFHLKRACMAFAAAELPVTPFPAYFLGSHGVYHAPRHLLPHASALHISAMALHEYWGILYYRFVGL